MDDVKIRIDEIYVPAKRRQMLRPGTVDELAESILEEGQKVPISVRRGRERFVLISGLHRLEACRALGEETIVAIVVSATQH